MSRLTHKDYHQACTILQQVYGLQDAARFPQQLLGLLSTVVNAEVYSYNDMNIAAKTAWYTWHPTTYDVIPDGMEALGRYNDQNPLIRAIPRQEVVRISDCIATTDFRKLPIYHEFYKPMRIPFTMAVVLSQDPQHMICLGLHHNQHDFSDRDVLLMNLLRPHIMQAFQQAKTLTTLEAQINGLHSILESNKHAVVCLDDQETLTWSTQRAWDLMQAYCPLHPHEPSRLPDLLSRWMKHQMAAYNSMSSLPATPTPLVIEQPRGQLIVKAIRHENTWLMVLEERAQEPIAKHLQSAGLTPREAEVLQWVAQGKSNNAIATILSVSPRTIHKHLERIYDKLGVENRTAAVAMMQPLREQENRFD